MNTRNDFLTLLRPTVQPPPASWMLEDPEWFDRRAGKGLTIMVDPEHPEAGRFAGFVAPPSGTRCYMNVQTPGVCIPTPDASPDGYRTFHADEVPYPADDDGKSVDIGVGTVALGRGHSNPLMATTPGKATEWLQRRERWASLAGDVALYGHVEHTPDGLLMRGHVSPGLTVAEADLINRTIMSGEWIPDPELGGALVFAGVARIDRTALPMRPLPMAASLEECGCDITTDLRVLTLAPADMPLEATDMTSAETITEAAPEPVRAGPDEDLAEIRAMLADITSRLEIVERETAALGALAVEDEAAGASGPGATIEDLVALVTQLSNEVSALREANANQQAETRQGVEQAQADANTSPGSVTSAPAATGGRS